MTSSSPLVAAAVQMSSRDDLEANLAEIERYLQGVAAAAGHPKAARLGQELQTLLAGSIMLGVANRTTDHVLVARQIAARLIATGLRMRPRVDSRPARSS